MTGRKIAGRPPKASLETYLLIRTRAAMGVKHHVLAKDYGITRQSVQRIAREGLKNYEAKHGA